MKVGPKSSLKPFLHRAFQLLCSAPVESIYLNVFISTVHSLVLMHISVPACTYMYTSIILFNPFSLF